jgi:large subunit ribosomal protein L22
MKKQAKAQLRHIRIAPRKIRLLIDLIRGMRVQDAVIQLEHSKKRAARPVLKLLQSATANAVHNFEMLPETLMIKTAFVDGGPILYRWQPRAMGRATPLRKRSSHVTLVLEGDALEKKEKKSIEKEATPATETEPAAEKKKTTKKKTTEPATAKKKA